MRTEFYSLKPYNIKENSGELELQSRFKNQVTRGETVLESKRERNLKVLAYSALLLKYSLPGFILLCISMHYSFCCFYVLYLRSWRASRRRLRRKRVLLLRGIRRVRRPAFRSEIRIELAPLFPSPWLRVPPPLARLQTS